MSDDPLIQANFSSNLRCINEPNVIMLTYFSFICPNVLAAIFVNDQEFVMVLEYAC